MVCAAPDRPRAVFPLGHPRALGARRPGRHDHPHPGQRTHCEQGQNSAD